MFIKPSRISQRELNEARMTAGIAPPERWQHGQESAPHADLRTAVRVASNADALRERGEIGDAEWVAAERFAFDYIRAELGGRDPEQRTSGEAPDFHVAMLLRVHAGADNHAIKTLLGQGMYARLAACLVDNMNFKAMGEKFFPRLHQGGDARKAAKAQIETLLVVLAGLYETIDRKRKGAK